LKQATQTVSPKESRFMRFKKHNDVTPGAPGDPGVEAAEWLLRLNDEELDPEEPYADLNSRNNAWLDWVTQSPQHLQAFLEVAEAHRRMSRLDPQRLIKIQELLESRSADVIRLRTMSRESGDVRPVRPAPALLHISKRPIARYTAIAALIVACSFLCVREFFAEVYSTGIGEQRTCKLADGSFVTMNTDSRIEVHFSNQVRELRLTRGEALFTVEHDSTRPFIVNVGTTSVRAIGTQFDVRLRAQSTDVSVMEGVVQVSATEAQGHQASPSSTLPISGVPTENASRTGQMRLAAGEKAQVVSGQVSRSVSPPASDILAWRQRRLVFYDATLADVAAEFNRYNHTRIRVEGMEAQAKKLSGIFDADHPQSLVLYAAKDDSLIVLPEGSNWVIRAR